MFVAAIITVQISVTNPRLMNTQTVSSTCKVTLSAEGHLATSLIRLIITIRRAITLPTHRYAHRVIQASKFVSRTFRRCCQLNHTPTHSSKISACNIKGIFDYWTRIQFQSQTCFFRIHLANQTFKSNFIRSTVGEKLTNEKNTAKILLCHSLLTTA